MTEEASPLKKRPRPRKSQQQPRSAGQRTQRASEKKTKPTGHYVKILYKDSDDNVQEEIILIDELDYDERVSYQDNIESLVTEISDRGGIWSNSETVIPFHRIVAFKKNKDSAPNKNDKFPPNSDVS